MKRCFLATCIICVTLLSCSKDEDSNTTTKEVISQSVVSSGWHILKFYDSATDETAYFSGYNFTFLTNGNVTATKNSTNFSGTWSISDSNSDDDSLDDLHFNILFTVSNTFDDLSDDWDILSYSANKLVLVDVSGGGGGTDSLIFVKN